MVTTMSSVPKKFHAVNPQFSPRYRVFVVVEVMVFHAFLHSIARITQTVEDEAHLPGTRTQRVEDREESDLRSSNL